MKLGTIIELSDGRVGTICYHNLDGYGGVWGRRNFTGIEPGFHDGIPAPEFMLRDSLRDPTAGAECVGEEYRIVERMK